MALRPRLLIHRHAGLTDAYTIEAFPGLLAAFRDLDDAVRAGITDGLTLVEILQLNHLPEVLKDHPSAVIPYLVTRDHFIQRVHRHRTGYWHPAGEGVEHFTPAELAAAADLLGGGTTAAFLTAAPSPPGAASTRSRCGSSTWGCSATPARPSSSTSGREHGAGEEPRLVR